MAAPASKTIKDLTGRWIMNKTLSDDFDPLLSFQGVGWMTRKTIGLASITLHVKQYTDEQGVVHVDIDQTLSGGIPGTTERRVLDWSDREHSDRIFGTVTGRSRFVKLADITDEWGKEDVAWQSQGWEQGTEDAEFLQSYVTCQSGDPWTANQVWGFGIVEGERRWVRRVVVRKGSEAKGAILVLDYLGEPQK